MKKKLIVAGAAAALSAAAAVPAFALENEFHGMFRNYFYLSNAYSGGGGFRLQKDAGTSRYAEQRARIQYTAKANDSLKLVTHFELDSRWGGNNATNTGKYSASNDAGGLDADGISLETKNVYLDFKVPSTPVRVLAGIQPFSDPYEGTFSNFDATGLVTVTDLKPVTLVVGWFRAADATAKNEVDFKKSIDAYAVDAKFAVNKDLTVGANYYVLTRDTGATGPADNPAEFTNLLGLNAAAKVGPAALAATFGYQFGDFNQDRKLSAFGATAKAKVAVGPGNINASMLYLSGNKNSGAKDDYNCWQTASAGTSYFNASNMWLLIRNGATINTSTSPSGADIANKGLGTLGFFAGYEGTVDKLFYNANVGYMQVDKKRTAKSASIGTELNATVGYKLYDNLSASVSAAYLILGDGLKQDVAGDTLPGFGAGAKADNPFMTNIALNYAF